MSKKRRYTLKELSKELDISVKALRHHIKIGNLSATKLGRAYYVKSSARDEFLTNVAIIKNKNKPHKRYYLCVHYDKCLYDAARVNRCFSCDNCQKFVERENHVMAFWDAVFSPETDALLR